MDCKLAAGPGAVPQTFQLTHGRWQLLGRIRYHPYSLLIHYLFIRLGDQAECHKAKNAGDWPEDMKTCVLLDKRKKRYKTKADADLAEFSKTTPAYLDLKLKESN